jgi:hypothetical protein
MLGEVRLRIKTQRIINVYEPGAWLRDVSEVTVCSFKKKPEATKCSDHPTISLIAYTG